MATFKTRARTLDMLGRQQIAGIPTAISELFKNAHDAYAHHVEIDYYRSDGLFVLRDDGVGMSRDDFIKRWLTIGTESKFDPHQQPPRDPGQESRPMLGEKGIGRLAIATIGPQLLVLTRAKTEDGASDLTAAFLNWSIFEWPGIDLEEIHIPVRSFSSGTLPSAHDVAEMVNEFRANAKRIGHNVECELLDKLVNELKQFTIDPQEINSYCQKLSLEGNHSGTHFIIKPASPLLANDIDGEPGADEASPLKKALLGFGNTMTPGAQTVIDTAFRDHKTEDLSEDVIAENDFFTPEEFKNTDHRIRGRFDEYGQFQGEISIYGDIVPHHVIPWGGGRGTSTLCGPFSIDFAAFEGETRHSTIPNEEYARLTRKTNQLGGLYIYRNGIRVLPYGDTGYDWLGIELRRTRSASYYYFSHRKMFGMVEIDIKDNSKLLEKAGREGFQENKPYRQFRSILRNFFVQIAADFFRETGVHSDMFQLRKDQLSKEAKAMERRKKQVSMRKKKFEADLNDFFEKVENGKPQEEASALAERFETELQLAATIADSQEAARKVLHLESQAQEEIRQMETHYRITRPQAGLSKATLRDWEAYSREFASLQGNVLKPVRERIEEMIGTEAEKARLSLDRHTRTEATLNGLAREARKKTDASAKAVRSEADNIASHVQKFVAQCIQDVDGELREVLSQFQQTDFEEMPEELFLKTRNSLERRIRDVTEKQGALLRSVLEQLQAVDTTGESSAAEQLQAIEQRYMLLEEEAEVGAQLAQLGMAIGVINHEFSATVRSIRIGLRRLKTWADANEDLREVYGSIRASFDHLDGYLTLFTPLQRRLYRKAVEIRGSEIRDFLDELFRARMERHSVTLTATKAFANAKIVGFPSSFYPVFVNLVDNAIFWLSQQNPQRERCIELDEHNGMWVVSDSGPGIGVRDREAVFDFGFTRKPGGQGMGLYIGRESLRRVGFDLRLIDGDQGAAFGILPKDKSEEAGGK